MQTPSETKRSGGSAGNRLLWSGFVFRSCCPSVHLRLCFSNVFCRKGLRRAGGKGPVLAKHRYTRCSTKNLSVPGLSFPAQRGCGRAASLSRGTGRSQALRVPRGQRDPAVLTLLPSSGSCKAPASTRAGGGLRTFPSHDWAYGTYFLKLRVTSFMNGEVHGKVLFGVNARTQLSSRVPFELR